MSDAVDGTSREDGVTEPAGAVADESVSGVGSAGATQDDANATSEASTLQEPQSAPVEPSSSRSERSSRLSWWLSGPGVLLGVLLPFALFALYLIASDPGPMWRATYYANEKMQGAAVLSRRERVPYVRVYGVAHAVELPKKGFSARWHTCLVVKKPTEVTFQLVSRDGSRLRLDGSVVVDNWGRHGPQVRAKKLVVPAGTHALGVDYSAHGKHAIFGLNVSIAGGPIQKLPPELLALPLDDQGRCPTD